MIVDETVYWKAIDRLFGVWCLATHRPVDYASWEAFYHMINNKGGK